MIRLFPAVLVVALMGGCSERSPKTLGATVEGSPVAVVVALQTDVNSHVVLRGTMAKKCPVAGCWFILQDSTGTIKVDTKNAGFAVVEVPLNAALAVSGRITTNGAERIVDATGVRY